MTTTAKGFTKYTNADDFDGPAQMNDLELFLEDLIDERKPDVASLPSSGNWDGRLITVGAVLYMWIAADGAWRKLSRYRLGRNDLGTLPTLTAGPSAWTDLCTVSATSHGGLCSAEFSMRIFNGASGANRTANLRVTCDGVQVGPTLPIDAILAGNANGGTYPFYKVESTPTAALHTWKLQGNASAGTAVQAGPGYLEVFEN